MLHQQGPYGKRGNLHTEQPKKSVGATNSKFESSSTCEHTDILFRHSELCYESLKAADKYRDEILNEPYTKDAREWLLIKMVKNRKIIAGLIEYEIRHPRKYGTKSNGKELL